MKYINWYNGQYIWNKNDLFSNIVIVFTDVNHILSKKQSEQLTSNHT